MTPLIGQNSSRDTEIMSQKWFETRSFLTRRELLLSENITYNIELCIWKSSKSFAIWTMIFAFAERIFSNFKRKPFFLCIFHVGKINISNKKKKFEDFVCVCHEFLDYDRWLLVVWWLMILIYCFLALVFFLHNYSMLNWEAAISKFFACLFCCSFEYVANCW